MYKNYISLVVIVMVFCACLVNHLDADIINLKGGLVFKGKVIAQSSEEIKLETFNGTISIPSSLIRAHQKQHGEFELYQEQLKKLKEDDVKSQYELAKWCKTKKLWSKALWHFKKSAELIKTQALSTAILSLSEGEISKNITEVEKLWDKEHQASLIPFTLTGTIVKNCRASKKLVIFFLRNIRALKGSHLRQNFYRGISQSYAQGRACPLSES